MFVPVVVMYCRRIAIKFKLREMNWFLLCLEKNMNAISPAQLLLKGSQY
jgi:hypothetical protein